MAIAKAHEPITPGVDDRFWINIQPDYDIDIERDLHADELARVTSLVAS